ncbi:hypothetical protein BDV98DRAFT_581749 [Pterulicium gracile]|uniref:Uncharacterized protein n=1 Tax=Pterulicium gracile TaxID=1884261 RepID=A0A5C3QLW1_9AGAR|nr:hypothetical protein BDV98DRAFT_581749 [Pterula gracilis]
MSVHDRVGEYMYNQYQAVAAALMERWLGRGRRQVRRTARELAIEAPLLIRSTDLVGNMPTTIEFDGGKMTDGSKYPDLHTAEEMECVQTNVGAPVRARDTSGFWLILESHKGFQKFESLAVWPRIRRNLRRDPSTLFSGVSPRSRERDDSNEGPTFNAHSVAPYEHAEATSMRREAQGEVYIRENFEFRAGVQSVHTVGDVTSSSLKPRREGTVEQVEQMELEQLEQRTWQCKSGYPWTEETRKRPLPSGRSLGIQSTPATTKFTSKYNHGVQKFAALNAELRAQHEDHLPSLHSIALNFHSIVPVNVAREWNCHLDCMNTRRMADQQ